MKSKKACVKAHHVMEERHASLEIEYFTKEQSEEINETVTYCIKKYEVSPDIVIEHDDESCSSGIYIIEMFDDYDKESGDFFECIIKKLNINSCDID